MFWSKGFRSIRGVELNAKQDQSKYDQIVMIGLSVWIGWVWLCYCDLGPLVVVFGCLEVGRGVRDDAITNLIFFIFDLKNIHFNFLV
jgi:hypothetical protein